MIGLLFSWFSKVYRYRIKTVIFRKRGRGDVIALPHLVWNSANLIAI